MYICVCIYIYTYTHTHIHIYIYISIFFFPLLRPSATNTRVFSLWATRARFATSFASTWTLPRRRASHSNQLKHYTEAVLGVWCPAPLPAGPRAEVAREAARAETVRAVVSWAAAAELVATHAAPRAETAAAVAKVVETAAAASVEGTVEAYSAPHLFSGSIASSGGSTAGSCGRRRWRPRRSGMHGGGDGRGGGGGYNAGRRRWWQRWRRSDRRLVGVRFGRWRQETFGRVRRLTLRYSLPLCVGWPTRRAP